MNQIEIVEESLSELRSSLRNHVLYSSIRELRDVQIFMQNHVFAVWDFMSLLKYLQREFTCVQIPWVPNGNPQISRFINEIVWGEESDVDEVGKPVSHFNLYLSAMREIGSENKEIERLLYLIKQQYSILDALDKLELDIRVKEFLKFTFSLIETGKTHWVASSFTFGRENIIPDMFLEIISKAKIRGHSYNTLEYYLRRHMEVDAEEHGPLSIEMVTCLCGNDERKWNEVEYIAKKSLEKRLLLWDAIYDQIVSKEVALNKK